MLTFKEYLAEGNFSTATANSVGKKANRKQEFAKLTRRLKNTLKSTINVLSLPFAYDYEKDLSKFTGKTVISFGVEFDREKISKVKQHAMQVAETGTVIPYLLLSPADINSVVQSPDSYTFHRVTKKGATDETAKLTANLDIIDLDYLGIPKVYPPGYRGKKHDSFVIVNIAARLLRPGGIMCVTFALQGRYNRNFLDSIARTDPGYRYDQLNINKPGGGPGNKDYFDKNNPNPQHLAATKLKRDKQGPSARFRYKKLATAANEYISQIVRDDTGVYLNLLWANMYKGGELGTSIMWRGVFKKA